jgi:hypothetical protein
VDLALLKALQVDRVAFPPLQAEALLDQVRVVLDGRVPDPAAFRAPDPAE